ncbi:uncharacterized protein LOC105847298 isoform X3 [Hydra vulgaris]
MHKSIKCIQQSHNYVFTTDALLYFNAIDNKHWTHHVISEKCACFMEKNLFGSEFFLFYVGAWCQCFKELLDKGLSGELIIQGCMNILSLAIKSFRESFVYGFATVSNMNYVINLKKSFYPNQNIGVNTSQNIELSAQPTYCCYTTKSAINITFDCKKSSSPTNLSKPVFNKYSRHLINKEDIGSTEKKIILDRFCRLCCFSSNETVLELISCLYEAHFNNIANTDSLRNEKLPELNPKSVFTESCVNTFKSSVFDGILVPVPSKNISNILLLQHFQSGIKNVVLINTVSYGVDLPCVDDVKIVENIVYNDYILSNSSISEQVINLLLKSNIGIIIHRGDLGATAISELNRLGILDIQIKSYYRLYCLSRLLSVSICYDLNDLSLKNIGQVEISQVSLFAESVKNTDVVHNTGVYLKLNSNFVKYYTVVLCERTLDLLNLLMDEFNYSLHRIRSVFKNKMIVLGHAENDIVSILKDNKSCNKVVLRDHSVTKSYHYVNDCEMFFYSDFLKEHVLKVFEKYLQLFDSTDIAHFLVEDFHFRAELWEDSLKCASLLMKTDVVEVNF